MIKSELDRSNTISSIAAPLEATALGSEPAAKFGGGCIFWLMRVNFVASIAMMVPLVYGLVLRITEFVPGHEGALLDRCGVRRGRWADHHVQDQGSALR